MFFRVFQRSFEVFQKSAITTDSKSTFMTLSEYTCFGSFVKLINKKNIHLQNGDINLNERELSKVLGKSKTFVHVLLKKMCDIGLLIKNKLTKNIVVYSWAEIVFKNDLNPFAKAIEHNKKSEEIISEEKKTKWIKRKIIDISKVYERMNLHKQQEKDQVHYNEDINLKKEIEREKENIKEKEEMPVDFDFSYGEDIANAQAPDKTDADFSSFGDFFKPPYGKKQKNDSKNKKIVYTRTTPVEQAALRKKREVDNALYELSFSFSFSEMIEVARLKATKSIDWFYGVLFGDGEMHSPEDVKNLFFEV